MVQDQLGFDQEQSRVIFEPDGLPEFKILSTRPNGAPTDCDLFWVDLGTRLSAEGLIDQIYDGIHVDDLAGWNGQLRFDQNPHQFFGQGSIPTEIREALQNIMGQKRICFIYTEASGEHRQRYGHGDLHSADCGTDCRYLHHRKWTHRNRFPAERHHDENSDHTSFAHLDWRR